MVTRSMAPSERTLRLAHSFIEEARRDLEKATADGSDLPPRIRCVYDRPGHATPEFRTLAVPIPPGAEGASPEVLSSVIARFARTKKPYGILLVLDAVGQDEQGEASPILIAEARDARGTRLFLVQPFRIAGRRVEWLEPLEGGWRDPGEEEMILDAAFS